MSSEQVLMAVVGAIALVSFLLALVATRIAAGARRESESAQAATRVAEARLADLEAAHVRRTPAAEAPAPVQPHTAQPDMAQSPSPAPEPSFVITHLGEPEEETATAVAGRIDGRLFADIVARESVIKAAGLAHGLRRALSPEQRNRIRFEMKQEVKRSRKQRKADQRQAIREWEARQRAALADEPADCPGGEDSAA
ncbi:hypothetical protein DDE18_11025 [Nocardioides gansuensis]|uniref:Uncharacterized protein n=1 Tax=Nocardioides gansuensis TaxID=2138300 RepID=A0A2T8FB09_9ACTN|nr:hypothetical protein [Nocardioides gansuensis]PVG82877.1 hypothetical protein DDE18_11025 [Nocardioides gansuensis]